MISFDRPAETWGEALPIGNGRLGAMLYSETVREQIPLNQDSIWYGGPQERINPSAREYLPIIRKLIIEEQNIEEAERLMKLAFSGTPQSERPYQTAGTLWIEWQNQETSIASDIYKRQLNLEDGMASCTNGMTREYLASYPDQVIAIHVSQSTKPISFTAMLTRERYYDAAGKLNDHTIYLSGNGGADGVRFVIGVTAAACSGNIEVIGENLCVSNCNEGTLYVAIETSYYSQGDLKNHVKQRLRHAEDLGYEKIRARHVEDYQRLAKRMHFQLGKESTTATKVWKQIEREQVEQKLSYVNDYVQFVRYLCISSSREGSLPSNLQGIWNDSMTPPWDSKYTININAEMNYWPVESCNLSECHLPLFEHLKRMHIRGTKVAKEMYGCRGFVAHHNTDIWADCAPQDIYPPATYWVMGAAWLSTHIWTHYCYTKDEEFLREMFPVIQDAVLFFHDYLIEDHGYRITCPSVSPENTYILPNGSEGCICAGATMDHEIMRDLFEDYLKASSELAVTDPLVADTVELLKQIPELKIGQHGQIQEWMEDYEEKEPGHRHISQLYALFPSEQITKDQTPILAKAAEQTLERRLSYGGGHTGWSCAWIINLYARLGQGDKAWENLQKLYSNSTFPNRMSNHPYGPNHDVFQIDGCFGALSGIMQMLVQSNEERTILLPALPADWSDGSVSGIVIVGGAEISMKWNDSKLRELWVESKYPYKVILVYEKVRYAFSIKSDERTAVMQNGSWIEG